MIAPSLLLIAATALATPGAEPHRVAVVVGGALSDPLAVVVGAAGHALADPLVQKRFAEQGQEIPPREQQTSEGLAAYHKAEIEKWWPIIKAANIKNE